MIITDFEKTIDFEKINLQRDLFCKTVGEKINFQGYLGNEYDDQFDWKGKTYFVEYKMDYLASKTGNLVLELITSINGDELKILDLNSVVIKSNDKQIILNNLKNYKNLSRHYNYLDNFIFFYTVDHQGNCFESFVFQNKKISEYFLKTFKDKKFILTKSARDKSLWYTVSVLYPIKEIKTIASSYKKHY